jgi:hypothetical protein
VNVDKKWNSIANVWTKLGVLTNDRVDYFFAPIFQIISFMLQVNFGLYLQYEEAIAHKRYQRLHANQLLGELPLYHRLPISLRAKKSTQWYWQKKMKDRFFRAQPWGGHEYT